MDAFDVFALASAAVDVRVAGAHNETLQAQLEYVSSSFSLVNSTVGPVNVIAMTIMLDLLLPSVMETVNKLLPLLPLPSIAGITFVNMDLVVEGARAVRAYLLFNTRGALAENCVRISTDATYSPPEEILSALPYLKNMRK